MSFRAPQVTPFWSASPPPPGDYSPIIDYHTPYRPYGDAAKTEPKIDKSAGRLTEYKRVVEKYDALAMRWTTEEEKDEKEAPKEIDKLSECCFVFRKKITPNGPNIPPTIMTYLDIKSWYLRDAGKKIIGTQAGISWGATVLQVESLAFVLDVKLTLHQIDAHKILPYYTELQAYLTTCKEALEPSDDDITFIAHLDLLLNFLLSEFKDIISELEDLSRSREMTWERIWALWKPGRLYFMNSSETDDPFVVRLMSSMPVNQNDYQINFEYIDYYKSSFGWKTEITVISRFVGRVATSTLDLYPFDHHSEHEGLREAMIARGRRWKELAGVHHQYYDGTAFMKDSQQRSRKLRVLDLLIPMSGKAKR
jgi:hypothetical protein